MELTRVERHGGAKGRKRRRRPGLTRTAEGSEAAYGACRGRSAVVVVAPMRQASFKPATSDDAAARCSPGERLQAGGRRCTGQRRDRGWEIEGRGVGQVEEETGAARAK